VENAFQSIQGIVDWTGWPLVWYLLMFAVGVLWLALVFWTLKDARKRIQDGLIIAVAMATSLVFPFIGTLVYAILRPPEYLADVRERDLEIKAMEAELRVVRPCPSCKEPVREDYLVCPKCRKGLRASCPNCDRAVEFTWKVCPYCARDLSTGLSPVVVPEATELIGGTA
jgi:RNA polymerase subunit RPABC4/transcription elongation factor Spt4